MFKVNNKNTRPMSLTLLLFFLLKKMYFAPFSRVSIVDFEQENISWFTAIKTRIGEKHVH